MVLTLLLLSLAMSLVAAVPTPERLLEHMPREATHGSVDPISGAVHVFQDREYLGVMKGEAYSSVYPRGSDCTALDAKTVQQRKFMIQRVSCRY